MLSGMLKRKVVVISGVCPGLDTTLARRCAYVSADLVLAGRDTERLDEIIKQVTEIGGRAVAVCTDITDGDQVKTSWTLSLAV